MASGLYSRIASLEVEIDGMRRARLQFVTPRMDRVATVVTLTGGGFEGHGEDVAYDPADQSAHLSMELMPLRGRRTLAEWSEVLDGTDLVPHPLVHPESFEYRRWAYEGALLDLALRQAGRSLGEVLGRPSQPVRFAVSPAGDPHLFHQQYPAAELKVDTFVGWPDDDMRRLAATGRVRVVDLKAHYQGDWVKRPDDPLTFSRHVAAAFPDAIIEDAAVGPEMEPFHREHATRTSFDAPIHNVADLVRLPPTRWCNIKPSRFGTLQALFECIDHCEQHGIGMYGGGQFEIGPGRAQIQALASVCYANGPNDVAPTAYNAVRLSPDLPGSPLPPFDAPGFGTLPT